MPLDRDDEGASAALFRARFRMRRGKDVYSWVITTNACLIPASRVLNVNDFAKFPGTKGMGVVP